MDWPFRSASVFAGLSGRTAITYGLSPARPKVTVFSPVSCSMAAISKVPTEMMSARFPRKAGPGSKVSVSTKSTLYWSSISSTMPFSFIHTIVGSGL